MNFVVTPRQELERLLWNDERNIQAVACGLSPRANDVIADCAKRLLDARAIDKDLERRAERNLRDALQFWRST